jgi:hypothetical protein
VTFAVATAAMIASANAQQATDDHLGTVHFTISCTAAQAKFNRAVAALQNFFYPETVKAFQAIIKEDPDCAIAYWGLAMSELPNPLVPPFPSANLKAEAEAIQQGKEAKTQSRARQSTSLRSDVAYYTSEFTRTGFRGGFNWYRNIDRNWELLAPFDGVPVCRAGALYRRRPRSRHQISRHGAAHHRLAEIRTAAPRYDHAARLRPYHPGGAGGRNQRSNDRLHSASFSNEKPSAKRAPRMANQFPPHLTKTINRLVRTSRQMLIEIGREPTTEELAKRLSMPLEKVVKLLNTREGRSG